MTAQSNNSMPVTRIPEARHSKTLRRASPAPMGRFPVPIAFSLISSSGCTAEERETQKHHRLLRRYLMTAIVTDATCGCLLLTQPRSGAHVGTRAHKSLRIRMTMTQERSPLALAWKHKQGVGEGKV